MQTVSTFLCSVAVYLTMLSVTETMPVRQPRTVGSDIVLCASEDQVSAFRSELCPAMWRPCGDGMLPSPAVAIFRAFPQEEKDIP